MPSKDFTDFWVKQLKGYGENLNGSDKVLKSIERLSQADELLDNECALIEEQVKACVD